jgi:hypothetical protein
VNAVGLPEPVPGREAQFVDDLFAAFITASDAVLAEEKRRREERRNSPQAKARRSAGARKGWETRRTREAAELAAERARWEDRPMPAGPVCGELYHDSVGNERDCELPPGHDGDCGEL